MSAGCLCWPLGSPAATIVVTNLAKIGPGTLRSALTNVHDGDVITFAVTGIITNVVAGGLTISNSITIVGPGANLLTITGTNSFRAFQVNNGATSSISGLTFYRCAGAINNLANLTVSNCVFTDCHRGGGINNSSNLVVNGCTFTDCRGGYGSTTYSEEFPGTSGGAGANGGAVVNSGALSANNCQFLNNTAGWGGTGTPGYMPLYSQRTAGGNGGNGGSGGAVYDTGTAAFTNCTFGGNTSGMGGSGGQGSSGTYNPSQPSQFAPGPGRNGGYAGDAGNGSAVWSANGARFVSCTFFNNTTGSGGDGGSGGDAVMPNPGYYIYNGGNGGLGGNAGSGALYCTGTCQLVACTFYQNHMGNGGSGGSGGLGVNNGSFMGGSGNIGNGANAGNGGNGGAIYGPTNASIVFALQNVLVAGNAVGYAGSPGSAGARVVNTGFPIGTNGSGGVDGVGPDLSGKFTSRSHNFISLGDGSTGFTNNVKSDLVGSGSSLDALLGGLDDNHGSVMTCALLAGSPALDAGDDTLLASNIVNDARGYARKAGTHVDTGAYEFQAPSAQFSCHSIATANGVAVTMTNTPGALFTLLGSTDITLPVDNWEVLGPMPEISPGQFQWTDADSFNYELRFFSVRSP